MRCAFFAMPPRYRTFQLRPRCIPFHTGRQRLRNQAVEILSALREGANRNLRGGLLPNGLPNQGSKDLPKAQDPLAMQLDTCRRLRELPQIRGFDRLPSRERDRRPAGRERPARQTAGGGSLRRFRLCRTPGTLCCTMEKLLPGADSVALRRCARRIRVPLYLLSRGRFLDAGLAEAARVTNNSAKQLLPLRSRALALAS